MKLLPAGMRNNNPGNIKYRPDVLWDGLVGPSVNTDQGDPQAVFASPELGMRAAAKLALNKYKKGMRTANQLIAGEGGWTPGYTPAAANIAKAIGVGLDDDLGLDDPVNTQKFLRALLRQEHGPASDQYPDSMITGGIQAAASSQPQGNPMAFDWSQYATGGASRPDSFSGMNPAFNQALAKMFETAPEEIRNNLRVKSGYRSPERQAELWQGALKKYGSPEVARKWVAPPGKSQHNEGYAADLSFLDPAALKWVHQNAGQYGLAFPLSNENWHVELATARNPDGPKGQEAYAPPMFGSMAPGGMVAQDNGIPMSVANHWNSLSEDGQNQKNGLEKFGDALSAATKVPPARINGAFSGDARQSGDLLLKAMQNPNALAQMMMKMRLG